MVTRLSPDCVNRYVGLAIQVARQMRQMTLPQLAAAIGLSTEGLARIEEGAEEASAVDMHLLAKALNLDVAAFFVGLDEDDIEGASDGPLRRPAVPDLLNATIGARIRRLREATGLSAAALAVLCGLRSARILRIENGKSEAAASELYAIAEVLGVSITYFFDGKHESDDASAVWPGSRLPAADAAA